MRARARVVRLPLLQKNYKFTKVFFWGKLTGTASDYYIAMGTEESYGNKKFFFWCARAYCDARLLPSTACGAAQPLTSGHARLLTRASCVCRSTRATRSQDGVSWAQLPAVTPEMMADCGALPVIAAYYAG